MNVFTGDYQCVSLEGNWDWIRNGTPCTHKGKILLIDSRNQLIQWNPDDFTYSYLFPNRCTPSLIRSIVTVGDKVLLVGHNVFLLDLKNGEYKIILTSVPQNSTAIIRDKKIFMLQNWTENTLIHVGHLAGLRKVDCCKLIKYDFQTGSSSLILSHLKSKIHGFKNNNTQPCIYEINSGF
jgi:hypothetical protein